MKENNDDINRKVTPHKIKALKAISKAIGRELDEDETDNIVYWLSYYSCEVCAFSERVSDLLGVPFRTIMDLDLAYFHLPYNVS